jgi:dimethylargininase
VVDEAAVLARMGTPSRRPEVEGIEPFLAKYRKLFRIKAPATLEGGDVLRMGRRIFAGLSPRTNSQGVSQLENFLKPFGYRVIPVRLKGCLHLKSACTPLDDRTLLANPGLLDLEPFQPVRVIPVDPDEPDAANVLRIGETLLMAEGYPKTRKILEKAGYSTHTVDISELIKAEAAITCSSILVTLHDRK